jgi:uncharacterized protein YecE (DUF72 family)
LADLIFGTSGWSYKEWVGPFYEKSTKMFSHYTRFFNTAEINSTFYRYPSESMVYGLNRASPKGFIFSAKLPRLITHERRLNPDEKVENHLLRFLELLNPLKARGKLGCILIQLPPSFAYERDLENLKAFFEMIPDGYDFAAEFRNPSWVRRETWNLLTRHNVAYCVVDEPLLPPDLHVTADFAYFRWHGRGMKPWYDYHYSEEELATWVPRITQTRNKVDKVYGYFNNHYHGYAVENCIEILEMLNETRPEHTGVKERIIRHNLEKRPMRYERRLEDFGVTVQELSVEDLLGKITDRSRLERGRRIKDEEIVIEESSHERLRAKMRRYRIEVNRERKVLRHDCDDWTKGLGIRRICKHVVKLFLMIPKEESREVIEDIIKNKDDWSFQGYVD